jgi:hypothetical protein
MLTSYSYNNYRALCREDRNARRNSRRDARLYWSYRHSRGQNHREKREDS